MTTKSILITVTISIIILKADLVTSIYKSKSAIMTLNDNRKNKSNYIMTIKQYEII